MSTLIRPEVSKKNPYYIPKTRYYELKYHCLQYREWKRKKEEAVQLLGPTSTNFKPARGSTKTDPVTRIIMLIMYYDELIKDVEDSCNAADQDIGKYILMGVTDGVSYDTLYAKYEIPCGKDMYYDRYRKFFYILDKKLREN